MRALRAAGGSLLNCGPNHERPAAPSPAELRAQLGPPEASSLADLPWWKVFDDPALVGYQGPAGRARLPLTAEPGQDHTTFDSFFGALNPAWEIDAWGRIRRANEAARAESFAAEDLRRGVLLSLVSDVASAYFERLELDRELEVARQAAASFQETLDLFTRRCQGGVGSKLQTSRAAALRESVALALVRLVLVPLRLRSWWGARGDRAIVPRAPT